MFMRLRQRAVRKGIEEAVLAGEGGGLHPVGGADAAQQRGDHALGRALGYEEALGDLGRLQAAGDET
jgi:hypothetical protein